MEDLFQEASEQLALDPCVLSTPSDEPLPDSQMTSGTLEQAQSPEYSSDKQEARTLHWPDTQNRRFFMYTEDHLIQDFKLSPCANLFHKWLLLKGPAGHAIKGPFEKEFQSFSEQCRGEAYCLKSIHRAKRELSKAGLYEEEKGYKLAIVTYSGPVTKKKPKKRVGL